MRMREKFGEQVKIKRAPDDEQQKYEFNFMVVDDFGLRFESDREKHAAVASFHEERSKKLIESLQRTFSSLREKSANIEKTADA